MTSIAYTKLRKEPGMDVLPRWTQLLRSDRHRVKRITAEQLRTEMLRRKLIGHRNPMWVWIESNRRRKWLPFDRMHARLPAGHRAQGPPF